MNLWYTVGIASGVVILMGLVNLVMDLWRKNKVGGDLVELGVGIIIVVFAWLNIHFGWSGGHIVVDKPTLAYVVASNGFTLLLISAARYLGNRIGRRRSASTVDYRMFWLGVVIFLGGLIGVFAGW